MGKITINGKDITKEFIPFSSGTHAGKTLKSITIAGKVLTLASPITPFNPNPDMTISSHTDDGLEIGSGDRNKWIGVDTKGSQIVKGGSWTPDSSGYLYLAHTNQDAYGPYIEAGMTLHLYYSGVSSGNYSVDIPLAQFAVNDHQKLFGHIYLRQHNGVFQYYINSGGRFKITRWDIT